MMPVVGPLLAWIALAPPAATADVAAHKVSEVGSFRVSVKLDPAMKRGGTLRLEGPENVVLFLAPLERSDMESPVVFAGRYRGGGEVTLTLRHSWKDGSEDIPIRASLPATTPPQDTAEVERALALAEGDDAQRVLDFLPDDSFAQFVLLRAQRRYRAFADSTPDWMQPRARTPELYDAFTGALSIQEALQVDVVLRAGRSREEHSVDIRTLRPPLLKSHDFEELRKGRTPHFLESARLVPADFWCAQFSSMESLLALLEFGDEWGSQLLQMHAVQATDSGLRARYEGQLALRADAALRPFYGLAVSDVAVCGSDPFGVEGSDLTVIFHVKQRAPFESRLRDLRSERRAAVKRAVESRERIAERDVEALVSPDRAVSSYLAWVGDRAVVSTSRAAMARVLGAAVGATPALADSPDYRCLRAIPPTSVLDEDAYLFLSDAFVRRVVGPEVKVGEARRVRCIASLRLIENAALLFRMENRRDPRDLTELWPDLLDSESLWCPAGGAYELDPAGARCLVHGSLAGLTPGIEVPVTRVTPGESDEYDRFARRYNDYWRAYFDPVGIRVRVAKSVVAETTILPLLEASAYDTFKRWVGGAPAGPIGPAPPSAIASIAARIDPRSLLPDEVVCRSIRERFRIDLSLAAEKAFGPEVALHLGDGDLRFDFRLERYLSGALAGGAGADLYLLPVLASISLPVAASASVKDSAAAEEFVKQVREALARESSRPDVLPSAPRFSVYDLEPQGGAGVQVVVMDALACRVRLYTSLTKDSWIVANQEAFLREAIDRSGVGTSAQPAEAHARLAILPQAWRLARPPLVLAYEEGAREACHRNLGVAGHVLRALGKPVEAEARPALERRVFGRVGICPDGGEYQAAPDGLALCTVHGSLLAPRQPREPLPKSALGGLLKRLVAIRARLRFTDDGLHTVVEIERG